MRKPTSTILKYILPLLPAGCFAFGVYSARHDELHRKLKIANSIERLALQQKLYADGLFHIGSGILYTAFGGTSVAGSGCIFLMLAISEFKNNQERNRALITCGAPVGVVGVAGTMSVGYGLFKLGKGVTYTRASLQSSRNTPLP